MKCPDGTVVELDRRGFCAAAGGCAVGLAVLGGLSGCAPMGDGQAIRVGPLDDDAQPGGPDSPDARPGSPDARPGSPDARPGSPDARPGSPDAAPQMGPTCGGGVTSVGAPSSFTMGTAKYFSSGDFFVVRDANGLYAVSSICTHAGCTMRQQGTQFYCPCHGAKFTLAGAIVSGPVFQPLDHYSMCFTSGGQLGVDTNTTTASSTRLKA